jgi:hypothetical protein
MEPTKKELALAALVMLTLPVFAEGVLRLSGVRYEPQLYVADPDRGWALRAGAEGTVTGEARQFVRINSHGFRDREHTYSKPPDTVRFAVLGNSWTEALQVPIEKTYCSLLERKLAECSCFAGKRVEVLNFGVSGYSTAQELLVLREEVRKYHPDFVLVAFYSARDVANNMRAFNNAANPEQSPYYTYRGESLVLDASFRELPVVQKRQIILQHIRIWVNEHFRVLQAVNALVRNGRARVAAAAVQERAGQSGVATLEHGIYTAPSQATLREAWHVTEGLLVALRDEAKAQGADLRIVTLANRPQVLPDPVRRVAFMQTLGVDSLSYADDRIRALGNREGIPVTTLAPALSAYAETHHVYLNGFDATNLGGGHWNETGHRLAAETIAADLCQSAGSDRSRALASTR